MKLIVAALFITDTQDPKSIGQALSRFKETHTPGDLVVYDPTKDPGVGAALHHIGLRKAEATWNEQRRRQADQEGEDGVPY